MPLILSLGLAFLSYKLVDPVDEMDRFNCEMPSDEIIRNAIV